MPNEVVKHHNDLNTVPMRNWTKEEMDFFFSIMAKLRDEGTREVKFNKKDLLRLANSTLKHKKRFADVFESLIKHVLSIYYIERTSHSLEAMNLFSRFKANWTEDYSEINLTVKVTEEFDYIINKLDSSFTQYELKEFTTIRSTYAKTVYRLLKQWRTIGRKEYSTEEFKRLLDAPEYYGACHIDKNVLEPVLRELPKFFRGLKVKKIKSNLQGRRVTGYLFTWEAEKTGEWIEDKYQRKKPLTIDAPNYMEDGYKKGAKELTDEEKAHHQQLQDKYKKDKPEVDANQIELDLDSLPWETEGEKQ